MSTMEVKLRLILTGLLFMSGHFLMCTCDKVEVPDLKAKQNGQLMVCYYTATSYFPVSKVPGNLCTHIIFSNAFVTPSGIRPRRSQDISTLKSLAALKRTNPALKVLVSLQQGFNSVVDASEEIMSNFSYAAVSMLQDIGLDGVDLDWEYPQARQKESYGRFIKIFSDYMKKDKFLLSAALPNNPYSYKNGYLTSTMNNYMDFMTAMTYDFHMYLPKDTTTGYNSPLYAPKGEMKVLSTVGMMQFYIDQGVQRSKLLVGLPLYGRSWTLTNSSRHGLHAPAVGKGDPSPFAHIRGIYIYPDTCVAIQQGATPVSDQTAGAAYLYQDTTWVAYDNVDTVRDKIAYMKQQNLAGVGVWAMHLDDLPGVCRRGDLPLLRAIKAFLVM